jgi:hypothetical protein
LLHRSNGRRGRIAQCGVDVAATEREVVGTHGLQRVGNVSGAFSRRRLVFAGRVERPKNKLQLRFLQQPPGILDPAAR